MSSDLELMVELASRLDTIEDQLHQLCQDGALLAACELYATYEGLRAAMGKRAGEMGTTLAESMPEPRMEIPGIGVLERRQGRDRKGWDWEHLLPTVTRRYLDPESTGEFPSDPMEVAERLRLMVEEVIGVTPSKGPRVTALRAIDLDPDEWCESKPGRLSVQITRNGEA